MSIRNLSLAQSIFILLLISFFLCSVGYFAFVLDDAYISFRYAYNLAHGFGLRFNPSDPAIEGYTNFLWVVLGAGFELLQLPLTICLPVVSIIVALITLNVIFKLVTNLYSFKSAFIAILLLACTPTFVIWSTSGLATMPYALLILLLFKFSIFDNCKSSFLTIITALALATIRFEGVFFCGFIFGLAFLASKEKRKVFKLGFITLVCYALYYSFRTYYFQDFWPNTVYMKVGLNPDLLQRGFNYLAIYFFSNPISFLALLALGLMFIYKAKHRFPILGLYLALLIYPVLVGGDFMPFSRFYLPLAIFQIIPLAYALNRIANKFVTTLAVLVGFMTYLNLFNISPFTKDFLRTFHYRYNKSAKYYRTEAEFYKSVLNNNDKALIAVKALEQITTPTDSITLTAIGLIGYYSKLHVYDCYGLINTQLRDKPVTKLRSPGHDKGVKPIFFLNEAPTIMNLNVDRKETLASHIKALRVANQHYNNAYLILSIPNPEFSITLLKRKDAIKNTEQQFVVE